MCIVFLIWCLSDIPAVTCKLVCNGTRRESSQGIYFLMTYVFQSVCRAPKGKGFWSPVLVRKKQGFCLFYKGCSHPIGIKKGICGFSLSCAPLSIDLFTYHVRSMLQPEVLNTSYYGASKEDEKASMTNFHNSLFLFTAWYPNNH